MNAKKRSGDDAPKRFDIDHRLCNAVLLEGVGTGTIHWHSHFLLSVFTRGEGVQHLNGNSCDFGVGTAILLSPFDFHYNETKEGETFDAYSVKFTHEIFNSELCSLCDFNEFPLVCTLSERDFKLARALCEYLTTESSSVGERCSEQLLRNTVEQLILLVFQGTRRKLSEHTRDASVKKALAYIHAHFKEDLKIEEVCRTCHYTPNYFSHRFKAVTGISFRSYLCELRLSYAYNLIAYGNKSCSEACFESGFNSTEYFSYAFKQKYGVTPKSCQKS